MKDSLARGVGIGGPREDGDRDGDGVKGGRVGIVEMQAGGWSFTARDMDGGVWVWGGCSPS